jgi:hypothetical protein
MFFIARVDAFGGIAEAEVAFLQAKAGDLFEDGQTVFFGAAGVGGGFVYDVVAFFQRLSDGGGSADEGFQIGHIVFIDGGGNGDDKKAGLFQDFDVIGEDDIAVGEFFGSTSLLGSMALRIMSMRFGIDIESDDGNFSGKFQGDGQSDVTESDDGQLWPFLEQVFVNLC